MAAALDEGTALPEKSTTPVSEAGYSFAIHEDSSGDEQSDDAGGKLSPEPPASMTPKEPLPLQSSKLHNVQNLPVPAQKGVVDANETQESTTKADETVDAMHFLLAKLSEQQTSKHGIHHDTHANMTPASEEEEDNQIGHLGVKKSSTPVSGPAPNPVIRGSNDDDLSEVMRLKLELNAAKNTIARQEQQLSQGHPGLPLSRTASQGLKSGDDDPGNDHAFGNLHGTQRSSSETLTSSDDAVSEVSDRGFKNKAAANIISPWQTGVAIAYNDALPIGINAFSAGEPRGWGGRTFGQPSTVSQPMLPQGFPGPSSVATQSGGARFVSPSDMSGLGNVSSRLGQVQPPRGPPMGFARGRRVGSGWEDLSGGDETPGTLSVPPTPFSSVSAMAPVGYQPRPVGTPLSPTATEFTSSVGISPWNTSPNSPAQTYVQPMEPLNYRRLLDRSVSCNWKYIVDKIICSNDQQASIFLQQKLKVGTAEQKFDIVDAIVGQAYPLMVNRFGNFLVQRCFEHGTPEQVVAIANTIRGNTLSLSMDAFGCHVVQKAFDAVPEEYKAIMVHELLRRIPETVIHRYACHVWQKLFELRWSDSPPQIMKYVNEALRGMWHEVALGETGSLVVQNIFENCLEEDKRPCINEVLQSIDIVAHGQFGNWCIQHICEHGAPHDRSRAIDHVLRYATEYSMDQFASKVVEKCLKIGGNEFLDRYLDRVCEGRPDRPRIPLIDISSDQYGNYLIQYILTHAGAQHREIVASHIRKHMVSLRGSKFGSRVGLLCCNPAYATRPGPAAGASGRFVAAPANPVAMSRFSSQYR